MQGHRVLILGGRHLWDLPRGWLERGRHKSVGLQLGRVLRPLTSKLNIWICERPSRGSGTNHPCRSPVAVRPELLDTQGLFVCAGNIQSRFGGDI